MEDKLAATAAIYEAFGRGDLQGILDRLSDEVRWEEWPDNSAQRSGVPWLQRRDGKAGVMGFFQAVAGLDIKEFRVLSLMAGGDQVVAEIVIEATVGDTGRGYRDEELHLWTFNDSGKVVRLRHYVDTAKHIAAAGVTADRVAAG